MEAASRNEGLEQAQIEDIISKYGELQEDGDTIILKDTNEEISLLDIYSGTTVANGSYSENEAKIELLEKQLSETNKELSDLKEELSKTTATETQILKDYTAYSNGELITGTMENRGEIMKSLNAGESYTIPEGYHNGNGKVTANSQTSVATKIYTYSVGAAGDDNTNHSGSDYYFTVDVKSLYPTSYTNYTSNNFYFITTWVQAFSDNDNPSEGWCYAEPEWTYDATSGVLKVYNLGQSVGGRRRR